MSIDAIHICRSFARDVQRRVESLENVSIAVLEELRYGSHEYPLYVVESAPAAGRSVGTVLLSAGVHGDEPAGVHALLDSLESADVLLDHFRLVVLPCVNPSGYESDTLETMSGANLNRLFGCDTSQPEVRAIEAWLTQRADRFRVTLDLHETSPYYHGEGFVAADNPHSCYLYETAADSSTRMGPEMIAALPDGVEVCDWPTIYKDVNDRGVISYPESCRNPIYARKTTLDAHLNGRYTDHSFTTETPTGWSIEKRIAVHLSFVRTALSLVCEDSQRGR